VILARLRRRSLQIGALLFFVVLAGATYQGVTTALERRRFPQPGLMGDVGGHQLHLYCTGEGRPTVLLEAPAAGMSAAWGWVQPEVAKVTRVCSYDRAGLGWREAGDRSFDPSDAAEQLHTLLTGTTTERPPYIVVGHGFGAALARLDAVRFGRDVAALVLVDPPLPPAANGRESATRQLVRASPWLARTGILRASRLLSRHADGLPGPSRGALTAFLNRPDHLTRAAQELSRWGEVMERSAAATLPPALPVWQVAPTGPSQVAFLSEPAHAAVATRAIIEAVSTARASHACC
jgi:pimeloyl-ACP methyl ester carboxylesterase